MDDCNDFVYGFVDSGFYLWGVFMTLNDLYLTWDNFKMTFDIWKWLNKTRWLMAFGSRLWMIFSESK